MATSKNTEDVVEPDYVSFDLDGVEREQVRGVPPKKKPFVAKVDGKLLTFRDPLEVDAVVLMTMEDSPARFFRATLDKEGEFEHMINAFETPGKVSGLALRGLMQGYRVHYGLDDLGNAVGSRR